MKMKFRRQHPINQFIVDFYCHKLKLVIEVDGEIHLKKEVTERDEGRQYMLENFGLKVLRYPHHDILTNLDNVILQIKQEIIQLSLKPL